jgi:dipeptidyl aminopeptidase/acylaminoacyl peptidase
VKRDPPGHGCGVYPLLAVLAAACSGSPIDPASRASDGLVFVRRVDSSSELARARIADGAVRPVTRTPDREEAWPYWSEPAGRVVFEVSSAGSDARSDLVLWDPRTGDEVPLAATPARDERWPDWAPGRPALAFAFRGGDPPSGIAIFEVDSGRATLVARGGERDFFLRPSWSKGAARIVAQRRAADGSGSALWLAEPGGQAQALTADPAWFDWKPFFTRDGSEVVFSRRPAPDGAGVIAVIAADGGEPRVLPLEPGANLHSARPSPARDEIAFVAERDGAAVVFLADLAGGNARALTRAAERQAFAPRWSPDGERLVVTTTPAGTPMPRLSDAEGLETTKLLVLDRDGNELFEAPGMMPDWMPAWR